MQATWHHAQEKALKMSKLSIPTEKLAFGWLTCHVLRSSNLNNYGQNCSSNFNLCFTKAKFFILMGWDWTRGLTYGRKSPLSFWPRVLLHGSGFFLSPRVQGLQTDTWRAVPFLSPLLKLHEPTLFRLISKTVFFIKMVQFQCWVELAMNCVCFSIIPAYTPLLEG